MVYSLENVRRLKSVTGIGIKKCMEALNENDNNFEKSLEWLKKYSISLRNLSSPSDGEVLFGLTFIKSEGNRAVSFVISCESDFAEKSESFRILSDEVGKAIFNNFEEIEKSFPREKKVEEIVEEIISSVSLSIKEKISIRRVNLFSKNEKEQFGTYLHNSTGKLCSLIIVTKENDGGELEDSKQKEIIHELALQVAVHKPLFISKELVPLEVSSKISEEIKNSLSREVREKKSSIVENIVNGKLNKWYSEVCFLEKKDFRNEDQSIKEIVSFHGIIVRKIFFEKI